VNYVRTHWRGEQGLARSFLLNGLLAYLVLALGLGSLGEMNVVPPNSIVMYVGLIAFGVWFVWALVGMVRCGFKNTFNPTNNVCRKIGGVSIVVCVLLIVFFTGKDVIHLTGFGYLLR
jgi:hypothetical protein